MIGKYYVVVCYGTLGCALTSRIIQVPVILLRDLYFEWLKKKQVVDMLAKGYQRQQENQVDIMKDMVVPEFYDESSVSDDGSSVSKDRCRMGTQTKLEKYKKYLRRKDRLARVEKNYFKKIRDMQDSRYIGSSYSSDEGRPVKNSRVHFTHRLKFDKNMRDLAVKLISGVNIFHECLWKAKKSLDLKYSTYSDTELLHRYNRYITEYLLLDRNYSYQSIIDTFNPRQIPRADGGTSTLEQKVTLPERVLNLIKKIKKEKRKSRPLFPKTKKQYRLFFDLSPDPTLELKYRLLIREILQCFNVLDVLLHLEELVGNMDCSILDKLFWVNDLQDWRQQKELRKAKRIRVSTPLKLNLDEYQIHCYYE